MATKTYTNIIIFGPTGDVGSHAARTASTHGAHVHLAMRDPTKPIPGLTPAIESSNRFTRIRADLTDAASVAAAVRASAAKAAYIYLVPAPPGALKASLHAMKDAGVEYVVYLSSFSVPATGLRDMPAARLIGKAHAELEVALEDVGLPHAALRPGYFASNPLKQALEGAPARPGGAPVEARVFNPDYVVDCIAPDDVGRAAGSLLVRRPLAREDPAGKSVWYLCGPQLVTLGRLFERMAAAAGVGIAVVWLAKDEWVARLVGKGLPPPLASYLAEAFEGGFVDDQYNEEMYAQAVRNVEELTGRKAMSIEEYVREHRGLLVAEDA